MKASCGDTVARPPTGRPAHEQPARSSDGLDLRLFQEQQTFPTTGSRRWTGAGKVERTEQTQDTHSLRANRQPRLVLFVMECLLPALPSVSAARHTRTIHRQRVAVNPHRTAPCHILQVLLARQTCFTRGHAVEGCLPAACCKKR